MCRVVPMQIGDRQIMVADIKQKYIQNIIDAAKKCDLIDQIVLFGSSIEERCRESSDMALAVFGNQSPSRALESRKYEQFSRQISSFDNYSQVYDILYFRSGGAQKSPILEEISKGEIIYAKEA